MALKMKTLRSRARRASERPDSGDAFVPDVARSHERLIDDAAEAFAEEFIASATSAEFVAEDARDETVAEEVGGPFLEAGADAERFAFAFDDDDEPTEVRR
jgi:hypothetical protein